MYVCDIPLTYHHSKTVYVCTCICRLEEWSEVPNRSRKKKKLAKLVTCDQKINKHGSAAIFRHSRYGLMELIRYRGCCTLLYLLNLLCAHDNGNIVYGSVLILEV